MLKKTITYKDYLGNERTEDFMFDLNTTELIEMQAGYEGGLGEKLQKVVKANDGPTIMKTFRELILKSYGVISDDGRYFEKSEEISRKFSQTEAYNQLFMELCTSAESTAAFIEGVIPDEKTIDEFLNKQKK